MKIKMKLFLLCAAFAPFLMITSSQQNGSRFGCVCALEKGNSNEPNEKVTAQENEQRYAELRTMIRKNMKILETYASENKTPVYSYFERIISLLKEDDFIESYKENQPKNKADDLLDFCFLSAILEGLLAARNQEFESIEPYLKKEFPRSCFPFTELKKLTYSICWQLKSYDLEFNFFYRGLAYFMHCLESKYFYVLICYLANVHSPYMQLFIASLMNFAYDLDANVDGVKLINIMKNAPDRLDSDDGVKSILSCFHFEEDLRKELLRFISAAIKKIKVFSVEKCEDLGVYYMVLWFSRLGCFDEVNDIGEVSSFVDEFIENINNMDQSLDQLYSNLDQLDSNCIVF